MEVEKQQSTKPSILPFAGLASAIAMGVVIGYGISRPSTFSSTQQRSNVSQQSSSNNGVRININKKNAPNIIRNRIFKTYGYFAGSLGITGLTAYFLFNHTKYSQNALIKMSKHPNWYLFTSLLSSIALLFATKFINYKKRPLLKHLAWIAMNMNQGAFLSVLGVIGGRLIIKALIYTACILGGISLISASAPDEKVLKLGSFLGIGLGILCGMSMTQWVYPSVGQNTYFQNINIYGGLTLFALQMAYDTKKILIKAKQLHKEYDPINEQIDLYLNSVNFFIDMIRLLLKQQEEERKRQQQQRNNNQNNQ